MAQSTSQAPKNSKTNSQTNSKSNSKSHKQWVIENVVSLGLALLIVFMIRSSIVEAFKIPSRIDDSDIAYR